MACLSIMQKKMPNSVGARTQFCFMSLTIGKGLVRSLFKRNWPRWSLCSWITMLRNLGVGSQCVPWSCTVPFCSLCQRLWSGPQTLHTVLYSALGISLGGRTPCLWCPCWLWTHNEFLVNGLRHTRKDFSCDGEQIDLLIDGAIWLFSLVLVQGDDHCIAEWNIFRAYK